MILYSHFYRHNSFCTFFWVSSFYLSVNIMLYQFTVTCIENWSARSLGQWIIESKVYLLSMQKGSRLQLCFWVVNEVPERNDWICESRYMSSSKCLFTHIFAGFYLPINPSVTTVYARSAFYPSLRLTLSLQSALYT